MSLIYYPIFRWQDYALSFFKVNQVPLSSLYFYYFKTPFFLNFPDFLLVGFIPLAFLGKFFLYLPHALNLTFLICLLKKLPFFFLIFLTFFSKVEEGLTLLFLNLFIFLQKGFSKNKLVAFIFGFLVGLSFPLCGLFFVFFQTIAFHFKKNFFCYFGSLLAVFFWFIFLLVNNHVDYPLLLAYSFREKIFPNSIYFSLKNPFLYIWFFLIALILWEIFTCEKKYKIFYILLFFAGLALLYLTRAQNPLWPSLFILFVFLKSHNKYKKFYPIMAIPFWFVVFFEKEIPPYLAEIDGPVVSSLENPYQKLDILVLRNQKIKIYLLDLYIVPKHVDLAIMGFNHNEKSFIFPKATRNFLEYEQKYAFSIAEKLSKENQFYLLIQGDQNLLKDKEPYRRFSEIRQKYPQAKALFIHLGET